MEYKQSLEPRLGFTRILILSTTCTVTVSPSFKNWNTCKLAKPCSSVKPVAIKLPSPENARIKLLGSLTCTDKVSPLISNCGVSKNTAGV